mgnify:CR=1 FL=1
MVNSTVSVNECRGSIGIGAMIVFIGLILVAAVASTVIISTVEDLQQDSENTSNDARGGLNDRVKVSSAYVAGDTPCNAELWHHDSFAGYSAQYPVGSYGGNDFRDPDGVGGNDMVPNDASSIQVEDGCVAIMYGEDDFSGWTARLGPGDHTLADINANAIPLNCGGSCDDDVESIKVLGLDVDLVMQLAPGSYPIEAQDIVWSVSCGDGASVHIVSEDIIQSGSSLLDGTNTDGSVADFVTGEEIAVGSVFKARASLGQCSPELDDKLTLEIHVDGGASSYYYITVRSLDSGSDLMFH